MHIDIIGRYINLQIILMLYGLFVWDMALNSFDAYRRVEQESRNPKRRLVPKRQMPRSEINHLTQYVVPCQLHIKLLLDSIMQITCVQLP
jgi:hypothetical protein